MLTTALRRLGSRPVAIERLYTSSAEDHVILEKNKGGKGVHVVTLNRPKELNALTVEMGEQFKKVLFEIAIDPDSRVMVVTGAGRAFSAGGKLDFLEERTKSGWSRNVEEMKLFYNRFLAVREAAVPVIAAINGPAVGAGLCFAAACDLRVAATDAKLGVNFVKLGLGPGMGSTHFLPKILGPQLANKMLLTGELISGIQAKEYGLVLEALPTAEVLPYALDLAKQIASASRPAVYQALRAMRGPLNEGLNLALQLEAEGQANTYNLPDIQEGLQAVREKREPNFLK